MPFGVFGDRYKSCFLACFGTGINKSTVEKFFLIFGSICSKNINEGGKNMREFSKEEARVIIELVKQAETGKAMDIEDFFKEIEKEERSARKYRKNIELGLSH